MTRTQISDLLRSHDELIAALIVAGKEIRKLQFGHKDSPVLCKLRAVLREARVVRKAIVNTRAAPKTLNATFRHDPLSGDPIGGMIETCRIL